MVITKFVDPKTKIALNRDKNGNLYYEKGKRRIEYINQDGIYDFVSSSLSTAEKCHYDAIYSKTTSRTCS